MRNIIFTYDLEKHTQTQYNRKRYVKITEQLLAFLKQHNIYSTVFVLGEVAEESPELIKKLADSGHEIGFHTYQHRHLTLETPETFRKETEYCKKLLEDLAGQPIIGFRAPAFSLTTGSLWTLDVLKDLGFTYSSSVLPVRNPINGFPGAPEEPFYWPNGILEIPAPVTRVGPLAMPFLGGIYFRYLPYTIIKRMIVKSTDKSCLWAYCHPHDFDHEEEFYVIRGTSFITSLLLWMNRKNTFGKLETFANDQNISFAGTFQKMVESGRFAGAPVFNPVSTDKVRST